jgi:integrase
MQRIRSDKDVERAKPGRTLSDFVGLYIHCNAETDLKSWVYRYSFQGKIVEKRLGRWPYVNFRTARDHAMGIKGLILDRIDPKEAYQWRQRDERTFKQAADEWIAIQKPSRRYNAELLLHRHGSVLAPIQIFKITKRDVDKAIDPLRKEHPKQAKNTIKLWERFFAWANFKGYHSGQNPATWKNALDTAHPAMDTVHHASLPYQAIPAFVQKLRVLQERSVSAVAMEFMVLTAARTSEVLEARWDEFDISNAAHAQYLPPSNGTQAHHLPPSVWTIPASRMKARKDHRVPLSPRAAEIIRRQLEHRVGDCPFMFTGYGGKTPLSKKSLYRIACGASVTAHGFRASFRSWAGERGYRWDVCEMALAHTVGSRTAQAYSPGDPFEERRKLMDDWATFCTS